MKYRFRDASVIVITILFFASLAYAQSNTNYKELPNFLKVNDHLYRGGQPRKGGINRLKELGIKTVINLRRSSEGTRAERLEAEAAGLKYFNVSMSSLGRPSDEQMARVLEVIGQAENQPVFIHCQRGSDRTGTVIAAYRISQEGWSAKEALNEAKQNGMRWVQFAKKDYITDYHRMAGRSKDAQSAGIASGSIAATSIHTERDFRDRFGRSLSAIEFSFDQTRQALFWFFKKAVSDQ